MATIHKLIKNGTTIFPVTITDAVVHPNTGRSLSLMIKEYDVSTLFPTEGQSGGNTYNLELAIQVLGDHLPSELKQCGGGMKILFISADSNRYVEYRLSSPSWSTNPGDWQEL